MANRLQHETSPYLLQHAHNPVDWYPWGEEAFEKAKDENKPVLVSIGYAACHWCHVMEHESFEDPAVAAFMNEHYISIKVDREEHPDVDHLYMDALQAMSGAGGWPLNMFVTPDKKPFYGGTYFPPKSMYGRSSWMELLNALHRAWHEKPEEIRLQSDQMLAHLKQASMVASVHAKDHIIKQEDIGTIAENLLRNADKESGGFGMAPKFPPTGSLQFLLEYQHFHAPENDTVATDAKEHSLFSLNKMIEGGIYDQLGGGFARYATDKDWLVPHFEKMLYDNALMISVMSTAFRITGDTQYRQAIEETINFCKQELRSESSPGFYCALDADSEGVEGKFYTWTWPEWKELMHDTHPAVAHYFGVTEEGNWEETNILNVTMSTAEILRQHGLQQSEWDNILQSAKQKLFHKRAERIRPATDDKMLLSWNALMNVALVDAAIALNNNQYLDEAAIHLGWMLNAYQKDDGNMYHVYKLNEGKIPAKLDDYAYLIKALYHFTSARFSEKYILRSASLMADVNEHFLSEDQTFYYFSSDRQKDILVRKIELYDGATPAANSVMMENLWYMGNLMERGDWMEQAEAMMYSQKQAVLRYPSSFARWAVFLQRYHAGLKQVVIAGEDAGNLLAEWNRQFRPDIFALGQEKEETDIPALSHKYIPGKTALYLCEQFTCKQPVFSIEELSALISTSAHNK
jgi:uncharacterized protein YyaL (SSP411 family)